jgi:hypothetical protein
MRTDITPTNSNKRVTTALQRHDNTLAVALYIHNSWLLSCQRNSQTGYEDERQSGTTLSPDVPTRTLA